MTCISDPATSIFTTAQCVPRPLPKEILQAKSQNRQQPPPPPIILNFPEDLLFIVKEVLDSRYCRNQLQFIDWQGYPVSDRTLEPARTLGATGGLDREIERFQAKYPDKPGPANRRSRRSV
uniref:Chromo domain-containing protein n=1 Tax=Spongospora subterranea TaxID=70186 RepID=A0A0H5QEV7_9EUKA|eukprot:CRZ00480.1 hypothetical protein [Spongospora subterranea]